MVARLIVLNENAAGTVFPLYKEETIIGRLSSADLVVEDGSVSRIHAKVFAKDSKYYAEDLDSSSGTFVNNKKIKSKQVLEQGDEIVVGSVKLKYEA